MSIELTPFAHPLAASAAVHAVHLEAIEGSLQCLVRHGFEGLVAQRTGLPVLLDASDTLRAEAVSATFDEVRVGEDF